MSASILAALGISPTDDLSPHTLSNAILASFQSLGISPQVFPELAPRLLNMSNDLDLAYAAQTRSAQDLAIRLDQFYSNRKKEYEDLSEEIKSSGKLLDLLSEFLAQFQGDLSSVSTSIAELQARSKLIENRLEGRRLLESKLTPYISKTIIPPELISTIMNTEPNESWIPAIEQLEIRLMSLRSTRSTSNEKQEIDTTEKIGEKLRLKASDKIRTFFIDSFTPFRLSISPNLQIIQASFLIKFLSFFNFLQRHSARTAHEVQKAYTGTALWYFETSFRRYVRALEKIKSRGFSKLGLVGDLQPSSIVLDSSIISHAKLKGSDVILAHMANDSSFLQPPEALFRSLSLVVIDNARSEWSFLNHFFGQASSETEQTSKAVSRLFSSTNRLDSGLNSPSPSSTSMVRKQSIANSLADSDSYLTECQSDINSSNAFNEQKSQTVIDLVFKQIMGPVFEYHKTFTAKLLSMNDLPDTNSIYAMIKLNEALISSSGTHCSAIETHLMGIKMQIWPVFQIKMNNEIQSLHLISSKKIDEMNSKLICKKYVHFFSTIIAMESSDDQRQQQEEEEEEEKEEKVVDIHHSGADHSKVSNQLFKLRDALFSLIQSFSLKFLDSNGSKKKFLSSLYQDIHSGLNAFPSHQVRSQAEAAYWRELVWRTR